MEKFYTDEKNVQILIALLKAHGIRKAILSPGSSNSPLVASLQCDSYFQCFSCVDERSAAYMACGLAYESGEPVLLSCTGATASRNYLPGMTEAFYRKLPILAVTSSQPIHRVGHHVAQVVDRSVQPNDTYTYSTTLPIIKDDQDRAECEVKVNDAIHYLSKASGGTVHINLQTTSQQTYTTTSLPEVRKISRYTLCDQLPELPKGKIAVSIGSHRRLTSKETEAIDEFCDTNNAVVFCDHTSNYHGRFRILNALIGGQQALDLQSVRPELTIHIGEVSGNYHGNLLVGAEVWRVNPDGVLRDTYGSLTNLFEMEELDFFKAYAGLDRNSCSYYEKCTETLSQLRGAMPECPFSNIWVASRLSPIIPQKSTIHFAILNSLRSWNLFELGESIRTACNVGGFGIDGIVSSILGASLCDPKRISFCVVGDLAFFYDMNAIGNRHVGANLRILLINNGLGTEFKTYKHHTSHFGDDADEFISAGGHFGQKSPTLVKDYAENLGFDYLSATNKEEFSAVYQRFVEPGITERPMVFEIFTNSDDECRALELMLNIAEDYTVKGKAAVKGLAKQVLGNKGSKLLKRVLR